MRIWNVVALLLALGLMVPATFAQQSDDDLRREVDQLKRDLSKVIESNARIADENARLRDKVETIEVSDDSLEARINALSENLNLTPATTVNSVANPITFTGEFRTRTGYVFDRDFGRGLGFGLVGNTNGFLPDGEDDDGSFVDARFNLGMTFEFDRNVVTHISVQSAGLYGAGGTSGARLTLSGGDLEDVDLYEGWVHINNLFGRKEFSTRGGRQEVVLGNEFQFGNNDYFEGETHDGAHLMWQSENFDLHFLWAKLATNIQGVLNYNSAGQPYSILGGGYDDDELYALYFTLKSLKNIELDLYWIYINANAGNFSTTSGNGQIVSLLTRGQAFFHTVGARIGGTFDLAAGFDYNIEVAYQFGDLDTGANLTSAIAGAGAGGADVDGLAVEAEFGLTLNADNNFRVFIRALYAEGAGNGDTGYIPLFAERHAQAGSGGTTDYRARYGLMDIIPMSNVITLQGGVHFDPRADWTVGATVLWAQNDRRVLTQTLGTARGIGWEFDLWADYRYSDQTTFSFGAGVFLPQTGAPIARTNGLLGSGTSSNIALLFQAQVRVVF